MNNKIFLASPHMSSEGYEMEYIKEAFDTNWIAPLGKNVDEFEKEIASYVGVKHAAALSAGTAALHLAFKLAGVGQGDIVLSSALTFSATCNPITYEKAIPVFIDSEKDTWNIDPNALEEGLNKYPNAKAVVVANLYGTPAKLDEIKDICERHGVALIEDAAESLGATFKGRETGSFGKFGVFSFNGNKIITTSGGGMLVSNDEEAIRKARFWSTQAREPERHYQHKEIGYNYRMSNICAGIGRGQMKVIGDRIAKKQYIYNKYKEAFADIPEISMNPMNKDGIANNWLSCIILSEGSPVTPVMIMDALAAENIETRPIWKPMNLQPVYKDCDFIQVDSVETGFEDYTKRIGEAAGAVGTVDNAAGHSARRSVSVGEDIFNRGICMPSDTKMTDGEQERVIEVVRRVMGR